MSKNENITICPKCGYKRTEDDNKHVSLEECPSCRIIYKKIKQILPEQVVEPINIEETNECEEKLINCEACKKEVSITAISCPYCGEPIKQKEQDTPASLSPDTSDKENKSKLPSGCLIALVIFALFALFSQIYDNSNTSTSYNTTTNNEQSSCYSLGYKFGKCAAQVMFNESCAHSDDIVIPIRCRGKDETQDGITAGTKFVYQRHQ